ncbi:MAG: cobalamin biosynthesis protein CbiX [Paracoccaceae bacterium]|nr:cobalamin biosynthesis protein CbiX [Paracoccaceae bacterium]
MQNSALIVAHGQPSDPAPAEQDIADLGARIGAFLPDWHIGTATLATQDGLKNARQHYEYKYVFPFFMADGWFIRSLLPKRLSEAGIELVNILAPFGLLSRTQSLATSIATEFTAKRGWSESDTSLILAAHGSGRSPYPANSANATAAAITSAANFASVSVGFIEETPMLEEAARDIAHPSLCLPLFVARWGHVISDIPAALTKAGFTGQLLDPIGLHPKVPEIIAAALSEA